jgi:hypothetical protein
MRLPMRARHYRIALLVALSTGGAACEVHKEVQCTKDGDCNLGPGGGLCLAASTGNKWCAYPDASCTPRGLRYSNMDVGDALSGQCVPALDAGVPPPDGPAPYGPLSLRVGGNRPSGGDFAIRAGGVGSNLFAVGVLNDPADLGGGIRSGAFVAMYNSAGLHLWSVSNASLGTTAISDVQADPSGDIVLTGHFYGTVNFGCGPIISSNPNYSFFVAKLRGSNGTCLWSTQSTGSETADGTAIAFLGSDVVVAGSLGNGSSDGTASLALGADTLTSKGIIDIFVARFGGTNGTPVWAKSFGTTKNDESESLATVGTSSIVLYGHTFGTISLGSSTAAGSFVARFGSDLSGPAWVQQYANTRTSTGDKLQVFSNGDLAVSAGYFPSITFGNITLQAAGSGSIAIARLDGTTGAPRWAQTYGNSNYTTNPGLSVLPGDEVVARTEFSGVISFGANTLDSGGPTAVGVFRLNGAGDNISARRYGGGTESDSVADLRGLPTGEIVLTGLYSHSIDFGAGAPLSAQGGSTIYLARVLP